MQPMCLSTKILHNYRCMSIVKKQAGGNSVDKRKAGTLHHFTDLFIKLSAEQNYGVHNGTSEVKPAVLFLLLIVFCGQDVIALGKRKLMVSLMMMMIQELVILTKTMNLRAYLLASITKGKKKKENTKF